MGELICTPLRTAEERYIEAIELESYPPMKYSFPAGLEHMLAGEHLSGKEILDVGCGTAKYTARFAQNGTIVHGVDTSPHMQKIAANRLQVVHLYSSPRLPFEDQSFDYVFSLGNLMTLNAADVRKSIHEMYRVLKPNGVLIASFIHQHAPFWDQNNKKTFESQEPMTDGTHPWAFHLTEGTSFVLPYFRHPTRFYAQTLEAGFKITQWYNPELPQEFCTPQYDPREFMLIKGTRKEKFAEHQP